jgi:glycosyltransferase involved in cell wall biosynthesis
MQNFTVHNANYPNCVGIILSTFNGEDYFNEQFQSLKLQSNICCHLIVRDDGSESLDYLSSVAALSPTQHHIEYGERFGVRISFDKAADYAKQHDFSYYAFCDQDDIWLPNKLERAINILKSNNSAVGVTCGRSTDIRIFNKLPGSVSKLGLNQFLFQNPAPGNTFVFTKKILHLYCNYKHLAPRTPHDLLVARIAALTGDVFRDETILLYYRMHSKNQIGILSYKEKLKIKLLSAVDGISYYQVDELVHLINEMPQPFKVSTVSELAQWLTVGEYKKLFFFKLRINMIESLIFRCLVRLGKIPVVSNKK